MLHYLERADHVKATIGVSGLRQERGLGLDVQLRSHEVAASDVELGGINRRHPGPCMVKELARRSTDLEEPDRVGKVARHHPEPVPLESNVDVEDLPGVRLRPGGLVGVVLSVPGPLVVGPLIPNPI